MTANSAHYRRLAYSALDINDPAAAIDAGLCCARALLDAAAEIEGLHRSLDAMSGAAFSEVVDLRKRLATAKALAAGWRDRARASTRSTQQRALELTQVRGQLAEAHAELARLKEAAGREEIARRFSVMWIQQLSRQAAKVN